MAFTGIAAVASGTVTTATVLAAVAEVGMVMTVVGAVTGSKSLMKIGGVLGLVGGVGGLINGAASGAVSGASTAASGAETMESAAGMADAAYGGAAGMEASQLAGIEAMTGDSLASSASGFLGEGASSGVANWDALVSDAQQTAFGAVDQATNAAATATPDALVGVNEPMSATKDVYGNLNAATEPARPSLAPTTQDIVGTAGNNPSAFAADGSKIPYMSDTGAYTPKLGAMDQKSWFSEIMDWAKKNEKLATSAATLISGGLSGMGRMKEAEMQQDAYRMRFGYGNQVANFKGHQPQPLIGAA